MSAEGYEDLFGYTTSVAGRLLRSPAGRCPCGSITVRAMSPWPSLQTAGLAATRFQAGKLVVTVISTGGEVTGTT
jgi:hypothetical protein